MELPKHISLTIDHNPQAINYETVEQYLDDQRAAFDISDDERKKAIESGELWVIHWYPSTPVGFLAVAASTFESAIATALETKDSIGV